MLPKQNLSWNVAKKIEFFENLGIFPEKNREQEPDFFNFFFPYLCKFSHRQNDWKGIDGEIYHLMQLWKNNLWVLLWVQYII
jgi:hypothetical protein